MVVGWYHSHPGFGCWLSSVDINTQQVNIYNSRKERGEKNLTINVEFRTIKPSRRRCCSRSNPISKG